KPSLSSHASYSLEPESDAVLYAVGFDRWQVAFEFSVFSEVFQHLGQRHNADHRHGEIAFHFLDCRQFTLAALLAVQRNQHTGSLRTLSLDDLHDFTNRRAGGDHVIDDQHTARQRRTHQGAAFAIILGFLPLATTEQVPILLFGLC